MRKVGSKHAAMASDPVQYLTNFGEVDTLTDQDTALAEKYLVRVWAGVRSNTTAETFDDLRLENYSSARAGIDALPPTSSVIRGQIQRGAFLVHHACPSFETAKEPMARQGPLEHGWEEHVGTLLPSKGLKPLPPSLLTVSLSARVRLDDVDAELHHILPWKSGQSILQKSITLTSVFVYLYNCFCLICKYLDLIKIQVKGGCL